MVTWGLLGPTQGFTERFAVTFEDGGTMDLRVGRGVTKESLTASPGPSQSGGPLWGRGVAAIDGPFDDQPMTVEHDERTSVSLRNGFVAGLVGLASIALVRRLTRPRKQLD